MTTPLVRVDAGPEARHRGGRIVPVRISLADAINPPVEQFVLGKMFPLAKSSVLFGPTGIGKTALTAQILFAFAAGSEHLWGLPVHVDAETGERGGPVVVYSAEDTFDDWKRKAATLMKVEGVNVARALERLYVIDKTEGIARLSEVVTMRESTSGGTISRRVARPTGEQDQVIEAVRSVGARLVLFETASRLVDEEDNASFSALQSDLGRIGRETGAAVIVSHHATKAASKENDSAIENARGGGALVANARNAVSLFTAESKDAAAHAARFPREDLVVLGHGKATSSTRRHAPLVLVRCSGVAGAYFALPEEVTLSPEQKAANAARADEARQREVETLGRLYDVVAEALKTRPIVSPSWLRDHRAKEIGVVSREVESLVKKAIAAGILRVEGVSNRGTALVLGVDPRKRVADGGLIAQMP